MIVNIFNALQPNIGANVTRNFDFLFKKTSASPAGSQLLIAKSTKPAQIASKTF